MDRPRDVFFDLDHTLWDFESNSRATLRQLYELFALSRHGVSDVQGFIASYEFENERCWAEYRAGSMKREVLRIERFIRALARFEQADPHLAAQIADAYVDLSPKKTQLMPGCLDILEYVKSKGYRLHILTNGFREVQYRKLDGSGLSPFFEHVFTSEEVGFNKPHRLAYERALIRASAAPESTWMIGDSLEADIIGAQKVGLTTVLYHPDEGPEPEVPHFSVKHLSELKTLL
jgi:putative hydrolase of the HAD superfamily